MNKKELSCAGWLMAADVIGFVSILIWICTKVG